MKNLLKKRRQAKMNLKANNTAKMYPYWTEQEQRACMKALKKYGTQYELIAKEIKTRSQS